MVFKKLHVSWFPIDSSGAVEHLFSTEIATKCHLHQCCHSKICQQSTQGQNQAPQSYAANVHDLRHFAVLGGGNWEEDNLGGSSWIKFKILEGIM